MQPLTQPAQQLLKAVFKLLMRPEIVWPIIAAWSGFNLPWIRRWRQRSKTRRVRDWLSVPAAIDVVSVVERTVDKRHYYAATLTYFYRRPELQMGEYEREFQQKTPAQEWVKQFKGRQVVVHVNPKNIAESILLDSDLDGLETHQAPSASAPRLDAPPSLSHGYHFVCAIGELVSIAGLAMSAVLLWASVASGGKFRAVGLLWAGGAMLAVAFLCFLVAWLHLRGEESARSFLHTYKLWCPAWMQWSLKISGVAFGLVYILGQLIANLPSFLELWMKGLVPHFPYILGCWAFLLCASFHTAVLRSQEQVMLPATND
jgi:hypothetical protein